MSTHACMDLFSHLEFGAHPSMPPHCGGGGGGGWGLVSIYSSTVHITRKFSSTCTNDWRYTLPAQGRRSRDKVELL
jgi:hypothetical protein